MLVQRLKIAILPLDLPYSGLIRHAEEILTTGKSHKKLDISFPKDFLEIKKVLQFKYATWNVTGLREREHKLHTALKENNIKISVITESKKKFQGTKEIENYTVIYRELTDTAEARQE
jgi:hypothetical protein